MNFCILSQMKEKKRPLLENSTHSYVNGQFKRRFKQLELCREVLSWRRNGVRRGLLRLCEWCKWIKTSRISTARHARTCMSPHMPLRNQHERRSRRRGLPGHFFLRWVSPPSPLTPGSFGWVHWPFDRLREQRRPVPLTQSCVPVPASVLRSAASFLHLGEKLQFEVLIPNRGKAVLQGQKTNRRAWSVPW